MPRGGSRPNSGPQKGAKYKPTLEKEAMREAVRQTVFAHMDDLLASQIANAKGIKYLVVRQKTSGKFLRVGEGGAKLAAEEELIEVWEKDPSVQAFTDLLNRALDKPKEQEQEFKLTADNELIAKLMAGRKRAADARKA